VPAPGPGPSGGGAGPTAGGIRAADPEIPTDEVLIRWLAPGQTNGSSVLPSAVDLEGTSVDRRPWLPSALPAAQPGVPKRTGVAETRPAALPQHVELPSDTPPHELFAVDCPSEGNPAHAEIRVGRARTAQMPAGDRPAGRKPKSRAAKERLREVLAGCFQVIRDPSQP